MADPISTIGSVIAVTGCAAESSKFIVGLVRGVASAPAEIHRLSHSLESLRLTLLRLQQSSTQLDSRFTFSSHFSCRLEECLAELEVYASKMRKVDTVLDKSAPAGCIRRSKARRCMEKIKWLLYEGHKMDRFLQNLRMYQSEFSLELSTLLLYHHPKLVFVQRSSY